MTISSNTPVNNYSGNGINKTFDFDFLIENKDEIKVTHIDNKGREHVLSCDLDYEIEIIYDNFENFVSFGQNITFPISSSSYGILGEDEKISLALTLPIEQQKEIKNSSKLNLSTLEWCLDYLTRLIQILNRKIERAVKVQEGSSQTADELIDTLQNAQINAKNSEDNAKNYEILAKNSADFVAEKANEVNENLENAINNIQNVKQSAIKIIDDKLNFQTRSLAEIVTSTIPLNDSGLHLLDGSLIQGNGIYKGFVDYMANLYNNDSSANFFATEDEWQETLSNYGVCGKFVYDSEQNTVRLPKITGFIEGADNINNVCDLVEAGLPNIQGSVSGPSGVNKTGAFVGGNALVPLSAGNSSAIREGDLTFNASLSNSIYGNSETVQPQAIKVLYYIVVGTTVKNEIEVDIDNVASDLNNKMDKDLLNVTQDVKERVISWGMPDWSNLIATLTNNVTYTATVNCIVDGKIGCSRAANSNVKIFNEIGNLIKETTFGYSSADVNQYYFQFVIPQGYSIKINGTYLGSGEVHPLKGVN